MNPTAPSVPTPAEPRRLDLLRAISRWLALMVVLTGGSVLIGWAFDLATLKSVLPGVVSMKANTAAGLILLGAALGLLGMARAHPWARRLSQACAGGAAGLGLLTLGEYLLGWNLHIDQLLFTEPAGTVGTLAPGRMAPSTALDFMLLGTALLVAGFRLSIFAAQLLALLAGLVASLTVLGYFSGLAILTGLAPYTQMAIHTALAFLLLTAGLLFAHPDAGLMAVVARGAAKGRSLPKAGAEGTEAGGAGLDSSDVERAGKHAFEFGLLVFTAALAVVITMLGFLHYGSRRAQLQQRITQELAAIADLKVGQIAQWRQERLADARVTMQTPFLIRNVAAFLAEPSAEARRTTILEWFNALQRNYGYEAVALFDAQGNPRLTLPPTADTSGSQLRAMLEAVPQAGDVLISDLHRGSTGDIHIDLIVPLRENPTPAADARTGEAQTPPATIGAVVFRIDPRKFLYPLIESWPTPSETAETLLVRREGEELVYLNNLRHRSGAAVVLRRSINDQQLPAAMGARGGTGAVEGVDYRGIKVLAYTRAIPDSPWFIVAKVDQSEIQAPLRREAWTVGLTVAVLLVSVALGAGLLWRHGSAASLHRELIAEREIGRLSRLYAALSQVNQAVVQTDTRQDLFDTVCQKMAEYGRLRLVWIGEHDEAKSVLKPVAWAGEDQGFITGLTIYTDKRAEGQGPSGTAVREGKGSVFNDFSADARLAPWRERLAAYRFLSGGAFPLRVRGKVWGSLTVYAPETNFFRSMEIALLEKAASDISFALDRLEDRAERKQTEDLLRREQALFSALFSTIPDNIYFKDRNSRFVRINDIMAQRFGLSDRGEAVGRTDADYFTEEHARQAYEDEQRVINTGNAIIGLEEKETWPDGRVTWVSTTKVPLRDAKGNITGLVGISRDVTAHRQAAEALREAEGRFRATFEQAAVGMAQAGLDGHWLRVNQRFCDIVGYTNEELCALTFQDITHPDDLKTDLDYVRQVLAGEIQSYSMEKRYLRKNHSAVWVNLTVGLVRDQAGAPKYFVSVIEDITERKQAEEARRQAEEKYRAIFENAIEGIYQTTPEGAFLAANPAMARILGYASPEELVRERRDIAKQGYADPRDRDEFKRRIDADGVVNSFEYEAWRKDGSKVCVFENARVVRDQAGRVLYYEGSMEDVTERKRAEEALRESQALYRSLVVHIPAGMFRKDREGRYVFVNDRFCQLKGVSVDEILGKTPQEFAEYQSAKEAADRGKVVPRQRTSVTQGAEHHELIMRTGQSIELEESYPQPDGRVEYFQVVKSPVFGPDGQVIGSQGIQFDITERREAEAALRESEQRFVQFMRNLSGLAYIKNLEGRYVFVNDAYERTFGIPVADWLGKTSDEFFSTGVAVRRPQDAAHMLAERSLLVTTEEVSTKAGLRFFNTIEFPIVRPDEPLLLGGISMDVTEIRQAQDEVQQLNTHLELRVRERTAELEAVNQELEAFSYSVSHDLRAPLRAIDGFARILVDEHAGALSVEGQRVLNVVIKESERMGRLIDDLLAFSRIGRQSLQPAEIDLAALVGEVYREQAAQAPAREIQLQVTSLPRANADPALIRQVLANLIGNAIKYTRKRKLAQIEVGGSVHGSENLYYVKDNGAGFDPRYADKLFGVFQRLHSEAEFEGTGVGLALVQRIINRHGGRVWAESQVDQGATFFFTLPSRPS
jgi:PAS domain S-box-containing protein